MQSLSMEHIVILRNNNTAFRMTNKKNLKHRRGCWKTTSTVQHNNIGKMSCSVESTELKNLSSINAAKTFYNTCTIDYSKEKSFIQSKVREMADELFNGWAISLDNNRAAIFWNKILATEMFNLTAFILPLIFQSGRTTFFSINLTEGYSQGDDRLIHSDRSDSEVKEQIFKYLQNVGAREDNKRLMDEVFELYSKIKKIQDETVVGEATPVSIEELEDFCSIINWKVLFENVYMNESYNKSQVIVQHKGALRKTCETLRSEMENMRRKRNWRNYNSWATFGRIISDSEA
ncbi:unnamed protein product [Schistosoma curassoni]|uniref:Peptidase_M13_N domain-containing protein n=1 Tax=Schistosoma curassoni TaxID=6186 RepID=A0A183KFZ0_9TREM|nr:unnamed protein product [Schistosoma curassoni]